MEFGPKKSLEKKTATFGVGWPLSTGPGRPTWGGGAGFDVKAGVVEENIERFDIKAGVLLALLGEVGPPSGPRGGTGGGAPRHLNSGVATT